MRIISGKYKGKHIYPGKNFKARPTTDYAKEGLFNILSNHFDFTLIKVLDLFSGTGSISYEFASRGCPFIDAVEKNPVYAAFIKKTSDTLGFKQITVKKTDCLKYIQTCKEEYSIIFADPPFNFENIHEIPSMVFSYNILQKDGWFILEHSKSISFTGHNKLFDHKIYGGVNFSLFRMTS